MAAPFDPYHRWLGIPPTEQPPTYYRLLGLALFESEPEVIRDAAEQRIAHVRNYQLGQYSALSQQILNELAGAKACLLDAASKAEYDKSLQPHWEFEPRRVVPPPLPPTIQPPGPHQYVGWLQVTRHVMLIGCLAALIALILSQATPARRPGSARNYPVKLTQESEPLPAIPPPEPHQLSPAPQPSTPPSSSSGGRQDGRAAEPERGVHGPRIPIDPPSTGQVEVPPPMPAPPPPLVEPKEAKVDKKQAEQDAAIRKEADKKALLARILERRKGLLNDIEQVRIQFENVNKPLIAADTRLRGLLTQQAAVRQQAAALEQQAASVPMIDPGRQQRLSALASSYDGCQRQYSALQSEARQVAAVREAFAQQLVPINANMDRLSREADQLRADWLTATDAYGYLRRREYDRAMAIFEEWIGMEPAYFEPYVARGMTQYQLGRKDLADLDFRKANVLDRRNAEIKKRELRKSLGYKG
jgi:hypothetical protein